VDDWSGIRIAFGLDPAAGFWRFPIETVSQSEDGFERNYQGSSFVMLYEIPPGSEEISIAQRLSIEMHG
jgi:alpha-amylase